MDPDTSNSGQCLAGSTTSESVRHAHVCVKFLDEGLWVQVLKESIPLPSNGVVSDLRNGTRQFVPFGLWAVHVCEECGQVRIKLPSKEPSVQLIG
jgi:hypothetical protein